MQKNLISDTGRIRFIDGLRGIAILMVALTHAYGPTYANYLPYGCKYCVIPIPLFWVGVQLFFLISGFVILMTLERCSTFLEFATRRWFRLFPAMLIASILILAFDTAFRLGPEGDRTLINLLPGILFISPSIINTVTGVMIKSMDAPFWSLYVEVCFYATFGVAYFLFGPKKAIGIILAIFLITYILSALAIVGGVGGPLFKRITAATRWLGFIEFSWFASGALFYMYYRSISSQYHDWKVLALAIAVGLISALTAGQFKFEAIDKVALVFVVALFAASVSFGRLQAKIALPFFTFFGFVSYPLYLMHNNMMLGLSKWIAESVAVPPSLFMPVIPFLLIAGIAWLIASYFEPAFRKFQPRRSPAAFHKG